MSLTMAAFRPKVRSAEGRNYQRQFALALIVLAGCSKPQAERPPSVPVRIATVSQISAPVTFVSNGVVEPLQTVAIEAQVGGTLDSVLFHEGEDVKAGQVLFRLDPRPFAATLRQAEATLARDSAQTISLRRDAERYRSLAAKDFVTKSQADQSEAAAAAMSATVQADKAAVDNARLSLSYATIRAPIAGRTGRLLVRPGNLVKPNAQPLVVVNQLRPILVRFPVYQRDFPPLQRHMARGPVNVRITAADSSPVKEEGLVTFLDNAVDSLTSTVTAKARFENAGEELWPGEYVTALVELDVEPNTLAVPSRALANGQQGSYVFVVGRDRVAEVRPVTIGRVIGDLTTIQQGLRVGEQVVTDGQSRLSPGMHVEVLGEQNAAPKIGPGS